MGCFEEMRSSWVFPTAVLSLYGFLANCRPAEPFLTPYLVGPYKNISEAQVNNYLFPIWTYSYLALLLPVFLLTDFLRYKVIVVLQGLFLVNNYVLLCFAQGLTAMTLLQVSVAVVTSTEVAYFSYIYSVVPTRVYQRATGYVRSAMLAGYTFGSSLGQVLVSAARVNYFYINAISLGIASAAFAVSLWLPMPRRGMFFRGETAGTAPPERHGSARGAAKEEVRVAQGGWCSWDNIVRARHLLWRSFLQSYSSKKLVFWSLWWALATTGYLQVFNYVQLLWNRIEPAGSSSVYNGGVEAVTTLVGAVAAFTIGHTKVTWELWGELALGMFSAVGSAAVFLMGLTSSIWASYAGYVVFKAAYMLLITIAMFQIAESLSMECYALTFGINNFIAVLLQTIMTAIVVDERALGMDIVSQFIVYGSYYSAVSLLFFIRGAYTVCQHYRSLNVDLDRHTRERLKPQVISSYKF